MRWCLVSFILIFSLNAFAEKIAMTNVPISEFVDWYSRKTGKGVIVPNDFNEKITVYNADISPENLPVFLFQ